MNYFTPVRQITLTAGDRHSYKESHDDISHSTHTHTYIHIVWSSEQQREHEPVFGRRN